MVKTDRRANALLSQASRFCRFPLRRRCACRLLPSLLAGSRYVANKPKLFPALEPHFHSQTAQLAGGTPMSNFSNVFHLLGRYPELAQNPDFIRWHRINGGQVWHETHEDDGGQVKVIVQSASRLSIFAALIDRDTSKLDEGEITNNVVRTADVDLAEKQLSPIEAAGLVVSETGIASDSVHAVRPVVDFGADDVEVSWEVEIKSDDRLNIYTVRGGDIDRSEPRIEKKWNGEPDNGDVIQLLNDWLSDDECHHPSQDQWRSLARQITQGANTPGDQAFRIWLWVRQTLAYDANITHISEFTWSDNLTRNRNGWRGICDEWAVVQITLLRAVGIPSVLKFLIWTQGGEGVGHACLEWRDGSRWRHMDALWSAFDNPAVYRQNGAANVTVMDASQPRDSRSDVPAWGVADRRGDEKFHPYQDFIISPSYPGNRRPGYSS